MKEMCARLGFLLVSCGLFVPAIAVPVRAAAPEEDEAFRLFQAAAEDFKRHDFPAAVEKLEQAYTLFPKPLILLKKGEALENVGRIEEALESYRGVVPEDAKMETKVQEGIRRLEALLERPVKVSVLSGQVTGAKILVDGVDSGQVTPTLLELPRGPHVIRVEKDRFRPFETSGFVARGIDTMVVDAKLTLLSGHVSVRLTSGTFETARVTLDGRPLPLANPAVSESPAFDVAVGRHELVCIRDGVPAYTSSFDVPMGDSIVVECELGRPMTTLRLVTGWSLLGGGLATTAVGTIVLLQYFDDQAYAESTGQRLVSNKQIVGPVLMGLGAGAAATGIVLLLRGSPGPEEAAGTAPPLRLSPVFSAGSEGAFAGVRGSF